MKLISLNTYFGYVFEPLMEFISNQAATTDVFCFQEILSNPKEDLKTLPYRSRPNLLQELQRRFPDWTIDFAVMEDDYDLQPAYPQQLQLGIVIMYKKTLPVSESGNFFIFNERNHYKKGDYETNGHNAAFIQIDGPRSLTLVTAHGNSQPPSKLDTPKRLQQSQKILDFLAHRSGEKIIMGDFNLLPETESIKLFQKAGYRNLVVEQGIKTTRGSHMRTLFPEYEHGPYGFQEFADYTFVSPGVDVKKFEVPDLPISDHLPMILEYELKA